MTVDRPIMIAHPIRAGGRMARPALHPRAKSGARRDALGGIGNRGPLVAKTGTEPLAGPTVSRYAALLDPASRGAHIAAEGLRGAA